jgi:hypothetical protein
MHRNRTADRPSRAVEQGQKSIPGRHHLATAKAGQLMAHSVVVLKKQALPRRISEAGERRS